MAEAVFGFQIRAEPDQKIEDVVAFAVDREMQRGLPFFKARHAAIEGFRILFYEALDQREAANGDCREM